MFRNFDNEKTQTPSTEFENSKTQTLFSFFKLTWSHYSFLMRIDDENERSFYEIETEKNNWSVRELKRQYDSALYTRLALSRDKEGVLKLSQEGQIIEKPKDIFMDCKLSISIRYKYYIAFRKDFNNFNISLR